MPEIKNMFQKGVMNKDLDERLVPNGQYRDAMNIQVSTSEGSEVGTVQNILGNIRVDGLTLVDFKCIGAVADEKNDVLYWFITSPTVDAIIEYHDNGTVTPILVDTNKDVLKFNPSNIITGINIIDNLLFWTDDVNEPKKINIDTFKLNSHTDLLTHSHMFVNGASVSDVTEHHITVIRKRPTKSPDVKFVEVASYTLVDMPAMNFYNLGIGSTITGYDIGSNSIPFYPPPFVVNDFILLSESTSSGVLPQNYQIKLLVTSSFPLPPYQGQTPGATYNFEVVEILNSFSDNVPVAFQATKELDVEPLFEKEFIRFATRYKYADGEYSAFSPFTQPVFVSGRFGFHPTKDPYNLGMENQILNIRLDNLLETKVPKDVVQLDILFKKERSTTVYSIDSIKINDPAPNAWNETNYLGTTPTALVWNGVSLVSQLLPTLERPTGQYDITVENIYAALASNQMLRPWDNVPRKALAQEITANRIVYGNYLQNYNNIGASGELASPNILVEKEDRSFNFDGIVNFTDNTGLKSIKSLRTYYLGVLYGDEYGRETPIFTNKEASINIPYQDISNNQAVYNAAKSLRLKAKLTGETPDWAYYYKFYIKQTTGEYYNLTMDRVYKSQQDLNLWLSFPSSDRNKVQEGDYLILKKQVDIEQVVPVEEKIKVIDIKNEAPESIKYLFISLGTGGGSAADNTALFPDINQQPSEGVAKLLIDREAWVDTEGGIDLEAGLTSSDRLAVQFSITQGGNTIKSKKYFVSAWALEDGTGNDGSYSLLLSKVIDPEDNWVESSSGVLNSAQAFSISIFKLDEKDATEFEGRFFMKVISNAVTQTYLVPSSSDTDVYRVLGKMNTFALANSPVTMGAGVEGIYNTQQASWTTTTTNITNTEDNWSTDTQFDTGTNDQGAFFIDNMYFVAAQEDTGVNIDAGKSGRMVKGDDLTGTNPETQYVNGLEGILQINTTQGEPYGLDATSGAPMGIRHWSSTVIRMDDNVGTLQYKTGMSNWDNTYNPLQNGYMMHLSFVCPGEDLHDGTHDNTSYPSVYTNGQDGIGDLLGSPGADHFPGPWIESQKIYATQGHVAKSGFGQQGNVNSDFDKAGAFDTDTFGDWGSISAADVEISQNQFNPGWKNPYAKSVIDNLVVGNRFQIDGDPEIYTILKVNKKFLYNHTAWNLSPTWLPTGNSQYVYNHPSVSNTNGDAYPSVCEAWANFTTNIYSGGPTLFERFKNTLENFGKANNRRVCYIMELDKDPTQQSGYSASLGLSDHDTSVQLRFVDNYMEDGSNTLPTSPAIFETEAKEDVDLNIYYEASDCLPVSVENNAEDTRGHLLAPIGSKILCNLSGSDPTDWIAVNQTTNQEVFLIVMGWSGNTLSLSLPGLVYDAASGSGLEQSDYQGSTLRFVREDGSYTQAIITSITPPTTGNKILELQVQESTAERYYGLPYYNCFSFGNGVESNRIRDDFNESYILNGVKASTVLEEPYEEERRKYGLIYSGIYNSISGVNNLNQFIQAEKITKDLMPSYGSIQKLYARDKDLITLCEDKVIRIYVDKDILYNADGNTQLLATNRVLGTAEPFRGNFGISTNPESFAAESFRAYFTDKQRGAVIRLSMDGLTPISDAGMHDYFRDNLPNKEALYGSYDSHKEDYNLSILNINSDNLLRNPGFQVGGQENLVTLSEELSNNSFNNVTTVTTTNPTYTAQANFNNGNAYTGTQIQFNPNDLPPNYNPSDNPLEGLIIHSIEDPATNAIIYDPSNGIGNFTFIIEVTNVNTINGDVDFNITNPLTNPPLPPFLTDVVAGGVPEGAVIIFGSTTPFTNTTTTDDWLTSTNVSNTNFIANTGPGTFELIGPTEPSLLQPSTVLNPNTRYRIEIVVGGGAMWGPGGGLNVPNIFINTEPFLPAVTQSGSQITGPGTYTDDIYLSNIGSVAGGFALQVLGGDLNIESISVKEVIPMGGTVLEWDLFENPEQGEIEYLNNPPKVSFNSSTANLKILSQIITDHDVLGGSRYRLFFEISNYISGSLTPHLTNTEGDTIDFVPVNNNGSHQGLGIVGTGVSVNAPINSVIEFTTNNFIGDIDNIVLTVEDVTGVTLTFNENAKGWTSFKSFVPEVAISSVNQYYTMRFGQLWKHHTNETRNTFYGIGPDQDANAESSITPILNMQPALVKNFNTLNYEGSQSKVDMFTTDPATGLTDGQYYNLESKPGWYVADIHTNKQEGTLNEFIEKEGKWFNYIKGKPGEIDTAAFNFQGLGIVETIQ